MKQCNAHGCKNTHNTNFKLCPECREAHRLRKQRERAKQIEASGQAVTPPQPRRRFTQIAPLTVEQYERLQD